MLISGAVWGSGQTLLSNRRQFPVSSAARSSRRLWAQAGVGPTDVDVAELYDAFTPLVLIQLEDYGFVGPGEAAPFIADGNTMLGGILPTNTHGGHLSDGYVHGLNHLAEAVRQLRRECGERQVDRCDDGAVDRAVWLCRRQHLGARTSERSVTLIRPAPMMDRDSRPWWEALARHDLLIQRCVDCAAWRWPARAICNRCASFEWSWERASGRAEVAALIVNHHSFLPDVPSPYAVVTARLAEQDDLLLPGSFHGSLDALRIGMPITATFDDAASDDGIHFTLLAWQPASLEAER